MLRRLLLILAVLAAAPSSAWGQVQIRQGAVYRYPVPVGWQAADSSNGVEMYAPDGSAGAYSMFLRTTAPMTPLQFARLTIQGVGYGHVRLVGSRPVTDHGGAGFVADFTATYRGVPVLCRLFSVVENDFGMKYCRVQGFHTVSQRWRHDAPFLGRILASVQVANQAGFAQQGSLIGAINHPNDNSASMEAFSNRQKSQGKISQWRREGTMGYQRNTDPKTGRMYNSPYETYDGTVGGYRNPSPGGWSEVLERAEPGE
jgi:hypothetical protein